MPPIAFNAQAQYHLGDGSEKVGRFTHLQIAGLRFKIATTDRDFETGNLRSLAGRPHVIARPIGSAEQLLLQSGRWHATRPTPSDCSNQRRLVLPDGNGTRCGPRCRPVHTKMA